MARPPRIQQAGAWYHVSARGIERRVIFRQDRDREHFLQLVERLNQRFACNVAAYVLMENHFHLFLQTLEPNLSRAIQWLTTAYAAWFNLRYDRCGHLFQGRFKAVVVQPDEWAVSLSRYIHLNPVRISRLGLGKSARAAARQGVSCGPAEGMVRQRVEMLRAFRWSSYRAYAGYEKPPGWLKRESVLQQCGRGQAEQRRWYREYCESAIGEGVDDCIWQGLVNSACLGTQEFWEQLLEESGQSGKALRRVTFEEVRKALEEQRGEKWEDFVDRHDDPGRDLVMYLLRERSGQSMSVIAERCGVKRRGTAILAIRRFERRLRTDKTLRKLTDRVMKESNVDL